MVMPFRSQVVILMYHRVFEPTIDVWDLSVSPENFDQQMAVLSKNYQVLSLSEFEKKHAAGVMPKRAVVVTFDDGYLDNLLNAKPILEKYKIPATIFITTELIGQNREYWWDELEQLVLLTPTRDQELTLNLEGESYSWKLVDEPIEKVNWGAPDIQPYLEMHALLKPLAPDVIEAAMESLRSQLKAEPVSRPHSVPVSRDQLLELTEGELIELGAHTRNHPSLNAHSQEVQKTEMLESKAWLEDLLKGSVNHFAYPYGDMDETTARIAKELGFTVACTTEEACVLRKTDPFWFPRLGVENWDGVEFSRRLRPWVG